MSAFRARPQRFFMSEIHVEEHASLIRTPKQLIIVMVLAFAVPVGLVAILASFVAGVAGAPKTGDKAAWAPRLATGMDQLYTSSLKGKGAMPPKGGNVTMPDADIKAAVDYMVSLVK